MRTLLGTMQPTKYDAEYLDSDQLRRAYDRSIAFYRELVEQEGYDRYRPQLREVVRRRKKLGE